MKRTVVFLATLLGLMALTPAHSLRAQSTATSRFPDFQPQEFDDPTGLDVGFYQMVVHPGCLAPLAVGEIPPDCLTSTQDEDAARKNVSTQDRALRAGILMMGQVWAMVETMKNIVVTGRDMMAQYEAIIHRFDKRKPAMTVIRIADATDAISDDVKAVASPEFAMQRTLDDPRYSVVNALALRALGVARDGEVANQSYGDAMAGASYRLAGTGNTSTVALSGDPNAPDGGLPPLPVDAPPEAYDDYVNTMQNFQAAGRLGPASPSHSAFGPQFSGTATASGGGETLQCQVPEDKDNMDPSVMYNRVATMIHGANTSMVSPMADVSTTREQIRVTLERERENVIESTWRNLLKMYRSI